jgi:hypothetical protein
LELYAQCKNPQEQRRQSLKAENPNSARTGTLNHNSKAIHNLEIHLNLNQSLINSYPNTSFALDITNPPHLSLYNCQSSTSAPPILTHHRICTALRTDNHHLALHEHRKSTSLAHPLPSLHFPPIAN